MHDPDNTVTHLYLRALHTVWEKATRTVKSASSAKVKDGFQEWWRVNGANPIVDIGLPVPPPAVPPPAVARASSAVIDEVVIILAVNASQKPLNINLLSICSVLQRQLRQHRLSGRPYIPARG